MDKTSFQHRIRYRKAAQFIFLALLCLFQYEANARAAVNNLPASLTSEVLSESVPTAFAPNSMTIQDFSVEWASAPIQGIEVSLEPGSLQWVRVSEVLVLPRARLRILARGESEISGGTLTSGDTTYPLTSSQKSLFLGVVPLALISGEANPLLITVVSRVKSQRGELRLHFRPTHHLQGEKMIQDPSCSRWGIQLISQSDLGASWMYVGCRLILSRAERNRTPTLEFLIFWDGVGQRVRLSGVETLSSVSSTWRIQLSARESDEPSHLLLESLKGADHIDLSYQLNPVTHLGSLSFGLGPYQYQFNDSFEHDQTVAPLFTLYGSYFLTENARVVLFDATAFAKKPFSDFGAYLYTEQIRTLDRRISVNLLLGAHALSFSSNGKLYVLPGAPQGIEASVTDFFGRSRNLSVGAFIYPLISDKEYYNIWVRWGSLASFFEVNYILWQESLDNHNVFSRSLGLTFGMPLAKFL